MNEDHTVKHILHVLLHTLKAAVSFSCDAGLTDTAATPDNTQDSSHDNYTNTHPLQESQRELSQHEYPHRGNQSS